MKRIGLLGGMSWESSIEYYRLVNEEVATGSAGSTRPTACCARWTSPGRGAPAEGRWDEAGDLLAAEARALVAAGAELLVLCTNTMHKVADRIEPP